MAPTRSPDDPWTTFALGVFRLHALIIRAGEDIAAPLGQTSARWQVLGRVHEPRTVADLARDIGHARQSVQRVADALATDGLVAYTGHPDDRRTKLVGLTPAGREVMSAIYKGQQHWARGVVTELDPGHLADTARTLTRISDVLERRITTDHHVPPAPPTPDGDRHDRQENP